MIWWEGSVFTFDHTGSPILEWMFGGWLVCVNKLDRNGTQLMETGMECKLEFVNCHWLQKRLYPSPPPRHFSIIISSIHHSHFPVFTLSLLPNWPFISAKLSVYPDLSPLSISRYSFISNPFFFPFQNFSFADDKNSPCLNIFKFNLLIYHLW